MLIGKNSGVLQTKKKMKGVLIIIKLTYTTKHLVCMFSSPRQWFSLSLSYEDLTVIINDK